MSTYHTITPNTIPHIYSELLLMSNMEYTTWILLCPLMFVVEICDAIYSKRFDFREEHWRDKQNISGLLNKLSTKITGLLIISWHILQNRYTWMAERPSTSDPHTDTLQIYLHHHLIRGYLSQHLPQCWVGRMATEDQVLLRWAPRSPDLTPCDFFFWEFKKSLFLPPLP